MHINWMGCHSTHTQSTKFWCRHSGSKGFCRDYLEIIGSISFHLLFHSICVSNKHVKGGTEIECDVELCLQILDNDFAARSPTVSREKVPHP